MLILLPMQNFDPASDIESLFVGLIAVLGLTFAVRD